MNDNQLRLATYIRKNCLEYSNNKEFFLGKLPGARYSAQFYMSRLLYNLDMLEIVGVEFIKIVYNEIGHWNFQITGREWSAIPLLTFLPLHIKYTEFTNINSFMIKRHRKTYGIHNYIEGIPNDLPVLIVDDICNSTNSFDHCNRVVKSLKLETIPFIFSVLNKYSMNEKNYEYDRYLGNKHKILSILNKDDLKNE